MFDQDAINDMVQIEITKAVASFAYKYGGQHNFQKQKFLFDLFNLKAECVNDFATPWVINLLCGDVLFQSFSFLQAEG